MEKRTYIKLSIALIIIVAILRFVFAVTHTVSGDACWHLSAARFMATENKIPSYEGLGRLQPFWAPPVFHFIAAFLYKTFSIISLDFADIASRLVSPIFGTLTVIILYFISRKFFDEQKAFYAMVFINFIPLFLDFSVFSFVDSATAFFSVLSVYLMLSNRYVLSSFSLGLAILSKYTAVFMYPMLLYLAYKLAKNKTNLYKRLGTVIFLPLAVSSVWFIRNFILFGNPIWPFLNGIFNGISTGTTFNKMDYRLIFSFSPYIRSYLELFGVPNGNISLISFSNIPFIEYLLLIWFIGTLFFIYPFVVGLFQFRSKEKDKKYFLNAIYISFLSYLFMLFVYLINTNWFSSRLLLPVVPFMALIWANGISSIKINRVYLLIVLFIGIGFAAAEGIKISTASKAWNVYSKDFEWVKNNTAQEDIFYGHGQCLSYNINRLVINHNVQLNPNEVDYAWVNNKWTIDFPINKKSLEAIENSDKLKVVYSNKNSGTVIYKVIR